MTKSEMTMKVADRLKLSVSQAETVVNTIFDLMATAMTAGERIEIRGFGSFEVRSYKAYEGRNPKTGESVHVKPKKLPYFKVGKALREKVEGG